jgi:hypothetical protein
VLSASQSRGPYFSLTGHAFGLLGWSSAPRKSSMTAAVSSGLLIGTKWSAPGIVTNLPCGSSQRISRKAEAVKVVESCPRKTSKGTARTPGMYSQESGGAASARPRPAMLPRER